MRPKRARAVADADPDRQPDEVHENTRRSEEGVERRPAPKDRGATLIGPGQPVDPRYVAQR